MTPIHYTPNRCSTIRLIGIFLSLAFCLFDQEPLALIIYFISLQLFNLDELFSWTKYLSLPLLLGFLLLVAANSNVCTSQCTYLTWYTSNNIHKHWITASYELCEEYCTQAWTVLICDCHPCQVPRCHLKAAHVGYLRLSSLLSLKMPNRLSAIEYLCYVDGDLLICWMSPSHIGDGSGLNMKSWHSWPWSKLG